MAGFEKLRIWQQAHKLMLEVHAIAKLLPPDERFKDRSQIERSSSSVPDNIAEGYTSYYYNNKLKGMYTARGEAGETQNHLRKLEGKKYIDKKLSDRLVNEYEELIKGINAYIKYIRKKRDSDN